MRPAAAPPMTRVPFGDLRREFAELRVEIESAVGRVLEHGRFILGNEVSAFEQEFADWLGFGYAVGCASGTDALALALRALGIGHGDEIILPVNTCVPTAAAVRAVGARPVPVDVEPKTLMIDVDAVKRAVTHKTKAIIPVHLYGGAADLDGLSALGVPIIEDCAQSQGSLFSDKKTGGFGVLSCFSFYPSKNLGAYGDGGAVVAQDAVLARKVRALRQYGQESRYVSSFEGINSRLDELQAAILRVKLPHLDRWNARRQEIASRYRSELKGVEIPGFVPKVESVYHLFPVLAEHRDELIAHLAQRGIEVLIHYPTPLHLQPAYRSWGYGQGSFPIAERTAGRLVSLPIFPQMSDEEVCVVARAVREFYGA